MKDLMGLMGKAREMQKRFEEVQEEISRLEATGQSGGGLVTVVLSGKGDLASLKIDPSLFKEDDVEILEDLVIAAHREARAKLDELVKEKTSAVTAGLPLPPGLKLPF